MEATSMIRFRSFLLGCCALGAAAIPLAASAQDDQRGYGSYGRSEAGYYGRDRGGYDEGWNRRSDRYGDNRWERDRSRDYDDRDYARDDDRRSGTSTSTSQSGRGMLDRLLAEHSETEKMLQQLRPLFQDARSALQQNDRAKAEQALSRADALLNPAPDSRKQVERSLDDLEQAVRRNDREAAEQALRRAREAVQNTAAAQGSAGGTAQSGSTAGGSSASGASGTTSGAGTGASRPQ
ncbi:MAG TPA: hypothetical protein VGC68_03535 [Enterovirga sp.]|jgi:hypothetical protein